MSNISDELAEIEARRKNRELGISPEKASDTKSLRHQSKIYSYIFMAIIAVIAAYMFWPEKVITMASSKYVNNKGDIIKPMDKSESWSEDFFKISAHSTFETAGRVLLAEKMGGDTPDFFLGALYITRNEMSGQEIMDKTSYSSFTKTMEYPPGISISDLKKDLSVVYALSSKPEIKEAFSDLIKGQVVNVKGRIVNVTNMNSSVKLIWIDDIEDITYQYQ